MLLFVNLLLTISGNQPGPSTTTIANAAMGLAFSKIFERLMGKKAKIIMIGLDAAGKTTILNKLKLGEIITTIPTIGFNVKTVEYKNISFTEWDVGGPAEFRNFMTQYYPNTTGLVFVVDSNDRDHIALARDEFYQVINNTALSNLPLLVFANKQDLPDVMSPAEIVKELGLFALRSRTWSIQACASFFSNDGLYEGFDWLAQEVAKRV